MAAPATSGATHLSLFVPATRDEPLRLVPLPAYDDSAADYDEMTTRSRDATSAYVGDSLSGLYDTFIVARDEADGAITTLIACVPDNARGQRRNAWWHAAGAGLAVNEVFGPLLVGAEVLADVPGEYGAVSRSLSITDWRDASGRTHAAEEWADPVAGPALLRQLCELMCRARGQREQNMQNVMAYLQGAGPTRVMSLSDPAAGAPACAACFATDKPLRKCSGCSAVRYCGVECQRTHWPRHRAQCQRARAAQS